MAYKHYPDYREYLGLSVLEELILDSAILNITTSPTTSAGGYELLTRNTTTGLLEKVLSSTFATTGSLSGYVPTSRTLTINGTTYDLSANRSWTVTTTPDLQAVTDAGYTTNDGIIVSEVTAHNTANNADAAILTWTVGGASTGGLLKLKNFGSSNFGSLRIVSNTLTAPRDYDLPNASGTIPLSVTVNSSTFTSDANGDINLGTISGGGTTTNPLTIGAELHSGGSTTFDGSTAVTIGIQAGSVTNSMLAGSIAYSKLSLTGSIVNGDIVSVAWSKITSTPTTLSGYSISDTKANFDAALSDGNFLYVGDVTQYTDEMAQDAIGAMIDGSLTYVDGTPLLQRAALTGDVTASAGSNTTAIAAGVIVNADINASAAIAYSKLNLTGSILNADLAGSITLSKLSITGTPDGTKFLRDDGSWQTVSSGVSDGDKGDVVVSSSGTVWTLENTAVTGQALTGYTLGTNAAVTSTDTILAAFGKVQKQIDDGADFYIDSTLTGDASSGTPLGVNGANLTGIPQSGVTNLTSDLSAKQAAIQFKDEGTNLGTSGTVSSIDFVGSGVTATRSTNALTVTISGGGGGGDVFLASNQTFTGNNTFNGDVTTGNSSIVTFGTSGTYHSGNIYMGVSKGIYLRNNADTAYWEAMFGGSDAVNFRDNGGGIYFYAQTTPAIKIESDAKVRFYEYDSTSTFTQANWGATSNFTGLTSDGTMLILSSTEVTAKLNAFVGDSGSGGTKGLVPAPTTGDATKFLKGDGTWATVSGGSGDVTKVGTPVNNQIGVWTGSGTLEGDANLTFDATTKTLTLGNGAAYVTNERWLGVVGQSSSALIGDMYLGRYTFGAYNYGFDVYGDSYINILSQSGPIGFGNTQNTLYASFNTSGELLINTTDQGAYKLQVGGDIWTNGTLTYSTAPSTYASGGYDVLVRNQTTGVVEKTTISGGSGISRTISSISSNTTGAAAASTDYVYLCSSTFTFTLPTAVSNTNKYTIKNTNTGIITINTTSSQTVEGEASGAILLYEGDSITVISNNTNWFIISG